MKARIPFFLCLAAALAAPFHAGGQGDQAGKAAPEKVPGKVEFTQDSFTFVRVKHSSAGRYRAIWATDYPASDTNFSARFQKETGLKANPKGVVMELTDPKLKDYPFLYLVEPGKMQLSADEVRALREYLLGGGFLMVDDFWGEREWKEFRAQIKQVFPNREPSELPLAHPVFNCFYRLKEKPQVPSVAHAIHGRDKGITWEREDGKVPHYRGLFDDDGRLMMIMCHNTDLGDGWERADADAFYFREFSEKKAYPMGINIAVYALTN